MTMYDKETKLSVPKPLATHLNNQGPFMFGPTLWRNLGFQSAAAFRQAKARNQVGIRIFKIPHRRGSFAFTHDVIEWQKNLDEEADM